MKKLLYLLICLLLTFSSCKKEDASYSSGTNNTSSFIIGTWKLGDYLRHEIDGYLDPVLGTEVITGDHPSSGPEAGVEEYMAFRDDNTCTNYGYSNDTSLGEFTMTYIINGTDILITEVEGQADTSSISITQLTDTSLSYAYLKYREYEYNDTTHFQMYTSNGHMSKSNLPSITLQPLNTKKPTVITTRFLTEKEVIDSVGIEVSLKKLLFYRNLIDFN